MTNIIQEVLSACISSAQSGPIKLKQGKKYHEIHSQLHCQLLMPSGSMKSTLLDTIPDCAKVEMQDYSYPALLGTISRDGDVVPGYVIKAAGKVLWIDEFHSCAQKSLKALLSLTEQQKATRVLGYLIKRPVRYNRQFIKYRAKDNEIQIRKARMSIIMSGLFAPHKKSTASLDDYALSSRLLPITLGTTPEEIVAMIKGKSYFDLKYKPYSEAPVFEEWGRFADALHSHLKALPPKMYDFYCVKTEFFIRQMLQFTRLLSWANRGNSTIVDWEKWMPYIPFFANCAIATSLTHSEYEVYCKYKIGLSETEIAKQFDVSQPFICKIVKKLRVVGLC